MRDPEESSVVEHSGGDLASDGLTRVEARGVFPMRDPLDGLLCKSVRRSSGEIIRKS
jgi:hypothetical protein